MKNQIIIVFSTFPNRKQALDLSKTLIELKLAACVEVGAQVDSTYFWNGEILTENETPVIIKTSIEKIEELKAFFMQNHPYDCPQWIQLDAQASQKYADWVNKINLK